MPMNDFNECQVQPMLPDVATTITLPGDRMVCYEKAIAAMEPTSGYRDSTVKMGRAFLREPSRMTLVVSLLCWCLCWGSGGAFAIRSATVAAPAQMPCFGMPDRHLDTAFCLSVVLLCAVFCLYPLIMFFPLMS